MKKILLPLLLFVLSAFCSAQTFTTSAPYNCNQGVCNGIPLDQGGSWQFIEANRAFSLYNISPTGTLLLGIYGNPGNPLTYFPSCTYTPGSCADSQPGGMYDVVDNVPSPPNLYQNGSKGAVGTLTFKFVAISTDGVTHYFGHVSVQGYRIRHAYIHGYFTSFVVVNAEVVIDDVQI